MYNRNGCSLILSPNLSQYMYITKFGDNRICHRIWCQICHQTTLGSYLRRSPQICCPLYPISMNCLHLQSVKSLASKISLSLFIDAAPLSNIATGETSPAITPFHFFGYSNFSNFYHEITSITC